MSRSTRCRLASRVRQGGARERRSVNENPCFFTLQDGDPNGYCDMVREGGAADMEQDDGMTELEQTRSRRRRPRTRRLCPGRRLPLRRQLRRPRRLCRRRRLPFRRRLNSASSGPMTAAPRPAVYFEAWVRIRRRRCPRPRRAATRARVPWTHARVWRFLRSWLLEKWFPKSAFPHRRPSGQDGRRPHTLSSTGDGLLPRLRA